MSTGAARFFSRLKQLIINVNLLKIIMLAIPLFLFDYVLRDLTADVNYLEANAAVPNAFSALIIAAFIFLVLLVPRTLGRIFYGVFYYAFGLYAFVQGVYYQIFGNILFLENLALTGEGAAYTNYVMNILTPTVITLLILWLGTGVLCIVLFPKPRHDLTTMLVKGGLAAACIIGIVLLPNALGTVPEELSWDLWRNPRYIYENVNNAQGCLKTAGLYQYTFKNAAKIIDDKLFNTADTKKVEDINEWVEAKPEHQDNEMTGIFEGKNVILVLMESMDDWLISEQDTPTIWYMMQNGINFTNFYTPIYGAGATFNTEFTVNTGIFTTGDASTYTLQDNYYPYSAAKLFSHKGYSAMSFHYNDASFYGRNTMHHSLGYLRYVSYKEYSLDYTKICDDTFITETDALYDLLTKRSDGPMMSFLITYSGHLDYEYTATASAAALAKYPEYIIEGRSEEFNCIHAQAHLTDDMFTELLGRLEEDGELENTVIVAFTDHYTYGILDTDTLWQYADEKGQYFLEQTPFFIYAPGIEATEVTKVCNTSDILPTVANLFGLEASGAWIGEDIFDDAYDGFAFFADGSWITEHIAYRQGEIVYDDGLSPYTPAQLSDRAAKLRIIDQYLLDTDYFSATDG